MPRQSNGGNTIWTLISICSLRTSTSSWFTVNVQLRCPTWLPAVLLKIYCFWVRIIFTVIGGLQSVSSSEILVLGTHRARTFLYAAVCTKTDGLSCLSLVYSRKSSSSRLSFWLDVCNRGCISAARCSMPARCMPSISNSKTLRRCCASGTV